MNQCDDCERPIRSSEKHHVLDNDGEDTSCVCAACAETRRQMREHAYLRHVPRHAVFNDAEAQEERDQELRDSGRGHLVRP
jgi:hypothetical protein